MQLFFENFIQIILKKIKILKTSALGDDCIATKASHYGPKLFLYQGFKRKSEELTKYSDNSVKIDLKNSDEEK